MRAGGGRRGRKGEGGGGPLRGGGGQGWRRDPEAPHTITFNMDFADPFQAFFPVGLDSGTNLPGHATMISTTQPANSGFLWAAPFPDLPPGTAVGTKFQVKFTQPGTYNYFCDSTIRWV